MSRGLCIHTSYPRCRSPLSRWSPSCRKSRTPGCCHTWGEPRPPATPDPHDCQWHKSFKFNQGAILYVQNKYHDDSIWENITVASAIHHLPPEIGHKDLSSVLDIKDLDRAIRRAGGQSGAVVIHLSIMLKTEWRVTVKMEVRMYDRWCIINKWENTHDHVLMWGVHCINDRHLKGSRPQTWMYISKLYKLAKETARLI